MDCKSTRQADNGNEKQEREIVALEKRYGTIGSGAVRAAAPLTAKLGHKQDRFRPKSVRDHD
jgi:hypothetical protein